MSEGISSCKKNNEDELLESILDSSAESSAQLYTPPGPDSKFYGLESHFNNNVVFYKDVTVHGSLNYDFIKSKNVIFDSLVVVGTSTFFGFADFYNSVYIDDNLNVAGITTVRQQLDVGCGGTTLTVSSLTGRVGVATTNPQQTLDVNGTVTVRERIGIGSINPQQRVDVAGSVKIDETIYDSVNVPGKNGYELVRDQRGIRWIPLIAEALPGVPGIPESGAFILNEMLPLDAPGERDVFFEGTLIPTTSGTLNIGSETKRWNNIYANQIYVPGGVIEASSAEFTNIKVSGVSTFTNGPVLIGTNTSNGTSGQIFQVVGGASFTGVGASVGIGTTNPKFPIHIVGSATTTLLVEGNSKFVGILTVGTNSIILDGRNNTVYIDGPTFIGSGTTTGTVDQKFQVTGGAYVSGNLGIGTTNPTTKLDVIGNVRIVGILTVGTNSVTIDGRNNTVTIGSGTTITESGNASYSGSVTSNSLSIGPTQVISSSRQLQNIASLDATTTATIEAAIANAPNTFTDLRITGITTLGITSVTNLTAQNLNVSGIITGSLANTLTLNTSGTGLSGSTTYNNSGATTFTVTSNATSANTGSAIVARDASGGFDCQTQSASDNSTKAATTAYIKSLLGSATTSGTLDWNDVSNTRPGASGTLLLGNAANGPSPANYFHPFNLEYASKDGTGNVTQLAISYGTPGNDLWMRGRYSGTWSSWVRYLNNGNIGSYAVSSLATSGTGISVNTSIGSVTITSNATSANTGSAIVARDSSGNFSAGTITGSQFTSTQANSTSTGGGQIYLNGTTGNRIDFNQNGVAAPTFTTRSVGTKIVLYPNIGASTVDFAFGIDSNTLWSSVQDSAQQFKWYAGTTNVASLSGTGTFTVNGTGQNIIAAESGTSSAWRGKILSKNSAADKASFLGVYASAPGVFAHNHALNAWATLYVNTTNGSDGGDVILAGSGSVAIGAASASYKLDVTGSIRATGQFLSNGNLSAWNTTTPATGVGGLHLGAASGTSNAGPAITFGARDASSGTNAQAGIYVNSDGTYGTRMYFATTDSYATGSKTAMSISETGVVNFVRATPTSGGNTIWHAGNLNRSDTNFSGSQIFAHNWFRTYSEYGLYSQSYGQHFYPDSGGFYWEIDGPLRHRDGYDGTVIGISFYHDGAGKGHLSANGAWWLNQGIDENGAQLVIGGGHDGNSYNSNTSRRLMFGSGSTDSRDNYYIGTNLENYGGNYNKLDIRWHTGIRMGAQPNYGGIRFYDTEDLGTQVFAIGKDGSYAQANQSMRAPIFYDLDNTGYYVDPNSTSNLALTQTFDLRALGQVRATGWYNTNSGSHTGLAVEMGVTSGLGYILTYDRNSGTYGDLFFAATRFDFDVQGGGFLACDTNIRAPLFYDSDNTAYYVDPNNTGISLSSNGIVSSGTGTAGGFQNRTFAAGRNRIWSFGNADTYGLSYFQGGPDYIGLHFGTATQAASQFWVSDSGISQTSGSSRAPIFYDSNDTGYYVDPAGGNARISRDLYVSGYTGGSYGNRLIVGNTDTSYTLQDGNLRPTIQTHGAYPVISLNHTVTSNARHGPTIQFTCNGTGNQFVIGTNGTGTQLDIGTASSADWNPHNGIDGYLGTTGFRMDTSGIVYNFVSNRSPIFYDYNNTGYYTDPASTSNLNNCTAIRYLARTTGVTLGSGNSAQLEINNAGSGACNISFHREGVYGAHFGLDTDNVFSTYGWSAGGGYTSMRVGGFTVNGTGTATGDFRAPIFYDSNNTGYYTDPASSSKLFTIFLQNVIDFPTSGGASTNRGAAYNIYQEAGGWNYPYPDLCLGFHTGLSFGANSGYQGMRFFTDNDLATLVMQINGGSSYIYKYYWMYTNTSGIYSDTNGAHISPNGGSTYTQWKIDGSRNSYGGIWDSYSGVNIGMYDSSGNGGVYREANGRWIFYHLIGNNCMGVNTSTTSGSYGMYVSGGIYSTGNVVAYSDARKKTNIQTIDKALDKVLQLRGVTFNKFDIDNVSHKKLEMGVIAQEVELIVPEVVTYAEDIDEYGVSYGNFAGLFIEAFKEQNEIINNLKKEIEMLKSKLGD